MIELGLGEKQHKISAPKREEKKLVKQVTDYYDPEKTMGFSRKKRKFVMKYPRRTFWRKHFMAIARNKKLKLNNSKSVK